MATPAIRTPAELHRPAAGHLAATPTVSILVIQAVTAILRAALPPALAMVVAGTVATEATANKPERRLVI